ncbi:MAG TPA: dihydrolipoamide acyltransferase [Nitrosospira sp.]|nr:dihydrolipoamide acyltransferase [Nitrosospira sp.]
MRRMRGAVQGHALRIFSVAILALLVGCVAVPENQPAPCPPPSEVVVTGQMDDMMQYYDSLRKQSSSELAKIYDRVKQNFGQNKSDANRIRLALLLTLPNTSFRDVSAALHLLNDWPRDSKHANNLQSFRNLLAALLAEQQRLSNNLEEASQKLKEEQKRADTLQHQIDAIKSMEKNLILIEP